MSVPEAVDEPAADPHKGKTMTFRKRSYVPKPTPEQARRQNHVLQSAWRHFRDAEPVIAFLNTRHHLLDAQPLHLAIQSDDGLERVERLLEQLTLKG